MNLKSLHNFQILGKVNYVCDLKSLYNFGYMADYCCDLKISLNFGVLKLKRITKKFI